MQADNERLTEEKGVLLESLCRQTEKLEDSRSKVDTLQGLLLREEQPQEASKGYNTEREQKLVDLLKVSTLKFTCKDTKANYFITTIHYMYYHRVRKRNERLYFRNKRS